MSVCQCVRYFDDSVRIRYSDEVTVINVEAKIQLYSILTSLRVLGLIASSVFTNRYQTMHVYN